MFHMLGRFVFTSSFSRRSSLGSSTGETRFGSCLCKNGSLTAFTISYQSIHRSLAMFRITDMARPRPNDMLSQREDFGRLLGIHSGGWPSLMLSHELWAGSR